MPAAERYAERVGLVVRVLPLLADEPDFALKGGTAINLFHRAMPRLSVDLDLTFLPAADREASLEAVDLSLKRTATAIERTIPGSHARTVLHPRASLRSTLEDWWRDAGPSVFRGLTAHCVRMRAARDMAMQKLHAAGWQTPARATMGNALQHRTSTASTI